MITTSPIEPTIGRVVYVAHAALPAADGQPVPAIINRVHSPNCISVTALPFANAPLPLTSIGYAEPEEGEALPEYGWWWMPYQKQIAAERADTELAAGAGTA